MKVKMNHHSAMLILHFVIYYCSSNMNYSIYTSHHYIKLWTHLLIETRVVTARVSELKEAKCQVWCPKDHKTNVAGQGQLKKIERMVITMPILFSSWFLRHQTWHFFSLYPETHAEALIVCGPCSFSFLNKSGYESPFFFHIISNKVKLQASYKYRKVFTRIRLSLKLNVFRFFF